MNTKYTTIPADARATTAAAIASAMSNVPNRAAAGAGRGAGAGAAATGLGWATVGAAARAGAPAAEDGGTGGAGALGAAVAAEDTGAAALAPAEGGGAPGANVGNLMVGAEVGLGGKLMRTVSFFGCTLADSAGFGGIAPPGGVGVFSAIFLASCIQPKVGPHGCQTPIVRFEEASSRGRIRSVGRRRTRSGRSRCREKLPGADLLNCAGAWRVQSLAG
jgi:hypothetical protein